MDGTLIDIVLGLVLVYLVLALLASKVQELVFGQMFTNRVDVMHDMLDEATCKDAGLKQRLLTNPAIGALYMGDKAKRSEWFRSKGPSAIPSDLFARALLVELFNDGKHSHPSTQYVKPFAFIAAKADASEIWGALRTMAPNEATLWPELEVEIAQWFTDIGNRADGWYQRKAMSRGLIVAFVIAGAANVNTFELMDRLGNEPVLRKALATLAVRVDNAFPGGVASDNTSKTAAPTVAQSPQDRVNASLGEASQRLWTAYFGNKLLSSFGPDRQSMTQDSPAGRGKSTPDARSAIDQCANAERSMKPANGKDGSRYALSDPSTWVTLLPQLRAHVGEQRIQLLTTSKGPDEGKDGLRMAYKCIGNLIGWVGMAQGANSSAELNSQLGQAVQQLESASAALLEWIDDEGTGLSVKRLFQADPDVFEECAHSAQSIARLRSCVLAQKGSLAWPVGWGDVNRRMTLCRVVSGEGTRKGSGCWAASGQYAGHPGLGIPVMALEPVHPSDVLFIFLGLLVTTVFVALGAPFWFDVLGRVVKLRTSGPRENDAAQSAKTLPSPASTQKTADAPASGGSAPFADALNDFERNLTIEDKRDLQQALDIPQTLVLDQRTRNALAERKIENGELTSSFQYQSIVGHAPAQAVRATGLLPPGGTGRGAALPEAQALSDKLNIALGRAGTPAVPPAITDDLRALAVLYRFKKERAATPNAPVNELPVVGLARNDGALDTISPTLLAEILTLTPPAPPASPSYPPDAKAPWLDYAIGELGQRAYGAKTREASDPRICSYLDAGGASPTTPDSTPWCAAFVSWCLVRGGKQRPGDPKPSLLASDFASPDAITWGLQQWVRPPAGGSAPASLKEKVQPGDVACFDWPDADKAIDHVAFVLDVAADGQSLLAIGGNQGQGQHMVSITTIGIALVVEVRRP